MSLITIDDDSSETVAYESNGEGAGATDSEIVELNDESSSQSRLLKVTVPLPLSLDEASCDTIAIDDAQSHAETKDKPILELMKHLINYNGKQNTTLTNAQLLGILKNEFDIDVSNVHFLTVDIYINVLKKFLKDWPQWDEFDRVMHELRCMNDSEQVEKMLEYEYNSLKEYLAIMLKACKPFAREAAQKAKRRAEIPESCRINSEDVILEVNCTRNQLNTLFFRKPHPDFNSTIFNVENSFPSKINVQNLTLKPIMNWAHVNITVNMNCFKYRRELVHTYKRTLINKKIYQHRESCALNRHLQMATNTKTGNTISKNDVKCITEKIIRSNRYNMIQQREVEDVFQTINEDLKIISGDFKLLTVFRHFMNPYPYVRYLYQEVDNVECEKYDLQLQEIVSPRLKFTVTRLDWKTSAVNVDIGWLKLECSFCNLTFIGVEGIEQLKTHFIDKHYYEPDWTCMNCEETYSAKNLASKRWYHKCPSNSASLNIPSSSKKNKKPQVFE